MHHSELLARRRDLGMTQAQVAAYLDVTANTVARWERGELTIRRSEMVRFMLKSLEEMHTDDLRKLLTALPTSKEA